MIASKFICDLGLNAIESFRVIWSHEGSIGANGHIKAEAVTWDSDITSSTGLTEASMAAGSELGLWIHREMGQMDIVGRGNARNANQVGIQWTIDGVTYDGVLRDYYNIENAHETEGSFFEIFIGEDLDPDLDGDADNQATSLPFSSTVQSLPGAGTKDLIVTVTVENDYGLRSLNIYTRTITIDSAGNEVVSPLALPQDVTVVDASGGKALVSATYYPDQDSDRADTWNIYTSTDGIDPVPGVDTPVQEPMFKWGLMSPGVHLRHTTDSLDFGADLRVIVTVERSSDSAESSNTEVISLQIGSAPEPQFNDRAWIHFGINRRLRLAPDSTIDVTVTTDVGNSIFTTATPGDTVLYAGATLVWRVLFDSLKLENSWIYIPSEWALVNADISGAGTDDLIETASWPTPKTLYVATGITGGTRTRRMLIDVTGLELSAADFIFEGTMPGVHPAAPIFGYDNQTVFSAFDAATARWVPYMTITEDGQMITSLPKKQDLNQVEVEAL